MLNGLFFLTRFSTVAASINSTGLGLAGVASGFGGLTETAKANLCFAILLGWLEISTLLELCTPAPSRI